MLPKPIPLRYDANSADSPTPEKTPMPQHKDLVSRRTFLRGTGVMMSLPWLESLPVWGKDAATAPPQRFAALFMGNGVHQTEWYAKGSGKEMQLGNCLKPLDAFKEKLNVISGLFNKNATGVGIHPGMTGNILSGASLQKGAEL